MNFTFEGDQPLVYPTIQVNGVTLTAVPGQSYDLPEAPDGRWVQSASVPASGPDVPTPAPEAPTTDTEPSEGQGD